MRSDFCNPFMKGTFVDDLSLDQIDIPEGKAPRNLVRSIQEQGLIEPPVVQQCDYGETRYRILAGIRRLQAVQEINPEGTVVAIVRTHPYNGAEITLSENIVRSRNFVSELHAFRDLRRLSLSEEDIQKQLGIYKRDVKKLAQLAQLSVAAESALAHGKISPSAALVLAKMPRTVQDEFFASCPAETSKYTLASVKTWRMQHLLPSSQLTFLADMPLH